MLVNQKSKSKLDHINIGDLIPHREPFLFIDQLVKFDQDKLVTSYCFGDHNSFYQGHFPNFPLTPGVILCEGMMQTGAALMNLKEYVKKENNHQPNDGHIYVASRMKDVKFKNMVKKGSRVFYQVELTDSIEKAFFFSGKVRDEQDKVLASMNFACNLTLAPNLH